MSRATGTRYEITVAGHLDDHWSDRLGGLRLTRRADGRTVLTGILSDQAQLHGVLSALRDIGVELLGLSCAAVELPEARTTGGHPVPEALAQDNGIPNMRSRKSKPRAR